jgi:hypothetical protein
VGVEIVVEVDDIDAAFSRARDAAVAHGGQVEPLAARPWGQTDFRLRHPRDRLRCGAAVVRAVLRRAPLVPAERHRGGMGGSRHRYLYIVQDPRRAGNALVLSFVDDLEDRVAAIARQSIEPARREVYDGGVTKVTYRDADGNEISLGGAPG